MCFSLGTSWTISSEYSPVCPKTAFLTDIDSRVKQVSVGYIVLYTLRTLHTVYTVSALPDNVSLLIFVLKGQYHIPIYSVYFLKEKSLKVIANERSLF